jgi:hypothetical protein
MVEASLDTESVATRPAEPVTTLANSLSTSGARSSVSVST